MARTPSRDVETALLAAAEEILAEDGPAALTVRKVASCAGIAPMGVYNRFDGKQGLLEALFVRGFQEFHRSLAAATGPDARSRLRDAALRYRAFALEHPQHYALMFEHMREVDPGPEALEHAWRAFEQLVIMVAAVREQGPFGTGSDVDVAMQWWSALRGSVSLELLGIRFDDDPATSFGLMVDALLVGLAAQAG